MYGDGWRPAVTLLRIFIVFTLARSVTAPSSNVYNALGRTDIGFRFTVGFTPLYLAAVLIGSRYGLAGVATGVALVRVAGAGVDTLIAARLVGLRGTEMLQTLVPAAAMTAMLAVVTATAKLMAQRTGMGSLGTMAVAGLAGSAAYLAAAALTRPPGYEDVRRLLRRRPPEDDGPLLPGSEQAPGKSATR